jgi:hypothetical protein
MNTPLIDAIQFFLMLALAALCLGTLLKTRRAAAADPPNPKAVKLMKLQWLYIVGTIGCFLSALLYLASWLKVI